VAVRDGYDVWLGNSRGSTYSRDHVTYDPDKGKDRDKYWAFSWQEMGKYDIPAVLDYVTVQTGIEKHAYIGHSQGTTQMFYAAAMPTLKTHIEKRVSVFIALGPVAKVTHANSDWLKLGSNLIGPISTICFYLGFHELLGNNYIVNGVISMVCNTFPTYCKNL